LIDIALDFQVQYLPSSRFIAFHWRSEPVLAWSSADELSYEAELRREQTAMWCAGLFSQAIQAHLREGGWGSAVLISDLPAPTSQRLLWRDRPRGAVDEKVWGMLDEALLPLQLVKFDKMVDTSAYDAAEVSAVEAVLADHAERLVTCAEEDAECRHCALSQGWFTRRLVFSRLATFPIRPTSLRW